MLPIPQSRSWAALLALALPAPALADAGEIVVTATRAEQQAEETGQALTIFDSALIEQRQTVVVSDLLATAPGVTVSRNGGPGGFTGVRIRGAEAEQTLVLIDGVRINDPSAPGGGFDFANLVAGSIERIELLRGPNSVPWGSQAIGGVVNIVTRRPAEGTSLDARAEYGALDSALAAASAGFAAGPVSASLGGGWYRTDGVSAFAGGSERDGYEHIGANGRVEVALGESIAIDVRGYYSHGRVELDGFPPPLFAFADTDEFSEAQEVLGYAGLRATVGALSNRLAFTITDVNRDNFDGADAAPTFIARGRIERFEYQGDWRASETLRAVFGAESETSRFADGFDRFSTGIDSLYGELIVSPLAALTLTGGVRYDDHQDFGGESSLGGNAALDLGGTLIRASYAEGFKAPTLFQLKGSLGNPGLEPERARSVDLGVEQRLLGDALKLSATWFHRRTRNQIDFVFPAPDPDERPFGTYANIARTRATGIEFALDLTPADWIAIGAAYTHVDAENRKLGNVLPRRPKDSMSVAVDARPVDRLSLGATLRLVGDSFDDAANRVRLDGYAVADLRADWALTPAIELYGRVENLFDARYQTVATYGTLGRTAALGLRARFQ